MIARLSRHGNSQAVVLSTSVLKLLGVPKDGSFEVVTDGEVLILKPRRRAKAKELSFAVVARAVMKRHRPALIALADR
ncbi:MAG: AbrB/MazE/SpoVT family DNA-binding domain-containing protein [Planctomycetes bacterium]|nr:AbrB/MazE/SpoVT family DNA-binding domain-containing protein [Planctomycetota bacterium]